MKVRVRDYSAGADGVILHREIELSEIIKDPAERAAAEVTLKEGMGIWARNDRAQHLNVFVPAVFMGFDEEDLRQAFNQIAPKPHWKAPIKAVIEAKDFTLMDAAAIFMTGGGLSVTAEQSNDQITVEGDGYWAIIGP